LAKERIVSQKGGAPYFPRKKEGGSIPTTLENRKKITVSPRRRKPAPCRWYKGGWRKKEKRGGPRNAPLSAKKKKGGEEVFLGSLVEGTFESRKKGEKRPKCLQLSRKEKAEKRGSRQALDAAKEKKRKKGTIGRAVREEKCARRVRELGGGEKKDDQPVGGRKTEEMRITN